MITELSSPTVVVAIDKIGTDDVMATLYPWRLRIRSDDPRYPSTTYHRTWISAFQQACRLTTPQAQFRPLGWSRLHSWSLHWLHVRTGTHFWHPARGAKYLGPHARRMLDQQRPALIDQGD